MKVIKVWAIKHKPTGRYMLQLRKRGYTAFGVEHWSATQPRIFFSVRGAKISLNAWLKGEWVEKSYQNYEGEWDSTSGIIKKADRIKEDIEIVCFKMVAVK